MSELREQVEQTIRMRRLFQRGRPVLVAVSGGLDSMVLLHLLHDLSQTHGWRLAVAHLNHQLRGRSSEADQRLVQRLAARLGLPITVERAEVRQQARARGLSLEMAAREARHAFLARAATKLGIRQVALAHHADDQIELFFLRLLRGSGGHGLAGMKWRAPSPADSRIELVRPLLGVPKSAIQEYAFQERIKFREDATNASLDIQRNRIRHELLPLLRRKYQPALDKIIPRVMDILGAEAALAIQMANHWLGQNKQLGLTPGELPMDLGGASLDSLWLDSFDQLPVAIQRRCLQIQGIKLGLAIDHEVIERLRQVPNNPISVGCAASKSSDDVPNKGPRPNPDQATTLPSGHDRKPELTAVFRDLEGIIHTQHAKPEAFRPGSVQADLIGARGKLQFDGVQLRWEIAGSSSFTKTKQLRSMEIFDADRVGSPVTLRHWQPGDRFQPISLSSAVKLQDFFTNQKVPQARRRELVLGVTAPGEIFWVEGMRISERFKLTKSTTRSLHWRWERP